MKRFFIRYGFHGTAIIDADSEEAAVDYFGSDFVQEAIKHNPQLCCVSIENVHEDTSFVDPFSEVNE